MIVVSVTFNSVSVAANVVSRERIVANNVVSKLGLLWSHPLSIVGRYS